MSDTINVDTVDCPIYSDCAKQAVYNYKNISNDPISIVQITGNGAGTGSYPKTPTLPNESSQVIVTFWRFPQEEGNFILPCVRVQWLAGKTYLDKKLYIKGYRKLPFPNTIKKDTSQIVLSPSNSDSAIVKEKSNNQHWDDSTPLISNPITIMDDCQTIYRNNSDSTYCYKNGELTNVHIEYKNLPSAISSKNKYVIYETTQIKSSRTDTWYCKRRLIKMPNQTLYKVRLIREIFENNQYVKSKGKWHNSPISHPKP
jgi:hypothetical protein